MDCYVNMINYFPIFMNLLKFLNFGTFKIFETVMIYVIIMIIETTKSI
jgi:hypothetical protein